MRARTREKQGAKINAKMMEVRSQMLAFSYDRQTEEGKSFKTLGFALCTLQY